MILHANEDVLITSAPQGRSDFPLLQTQAVGFLSSDIHGHDCVIRQKF